MINKQTNNHSDVENHIKFSPHFSSPVLAPALFLVAGFFVVLAAVLFGIVLYLHFTVISSIGFWIIVIFMGSVGFFCFSFFGSKGLVFWIETYERYVISRAQRQRNAILFQNDGMVAITSTAPVRVLSSTPVRELSSGSERDEDQNIVESTMIDITNVPNFSQLLPELQQIAIEDQSKPANEKRIHLGYTANGPRVLKFEDIRSIAVSGVQGFGKTVTMTFIVLQAVLHGFKIVLLDQHANNKEGITNKLKGIANSIVRSCDGSELIETLHMVWNELLRRKRPNEQPGSNWLIVLDELPAMIRENRGTDGFEVIDKTLTALNDEGRKYGMFVIAGAQRWKQTSIGKADLRQSFPTQICHRNALPEVALFMSCTQKEAIEGSRLPKGQSFVNDSVEYMTRTQFPFTTDQDSITVGQITDLDTKTLEVFKTNENTSKVIELTRSFEKPAKNLYETSPEAALERFRELWYKNATKAKILAEIFGAPCPGDNKPYKNACAAYDTMLTTILEEKENDTDEEDEAIEL